ncbi:MAG TPA: 50S ribosomal protein L24 [Candidatus Nanoarchaeia archaeon]|nr:50S ribosomal protein L24 [Candidatus Nanoarchaeia archaeon]
MKQFSSDWKSSKKPKKQRKYRFEAPLHIKQKLVHVHLSKDLRAKHKMRSIGVKKGDVVKIQRGQYKKKEGKVERVDLKDSKIFVHGVELAKRDGSKKLLAIDPSNVMITELNTDDKLRLKTETKESKSDKKEKK